MGLTEKISNELWLSFKGLLQTKWRSFGALLCVWLCIAFIYFYETPKLFESFDKNSSYGYLAVALIASTIIWVFLKYKHQFLEQEKIKFGIIINTENRSADAIERILKPIIKELSEQIPEIRFIELTGKEFQTTEGAHAFLKKNDYGLNQVLRLKADIGKEGGKDKFIIKEACFHAYNVPVCFRINDVNVDLRKEIPMRGPDQLSFSMEEELKGMHDVRLQLKDIIYYYLGLISVCSGLPELGLSILKRLFNPDDHIGESEVVDGKVRVRLNKKFFLSSRLLLILTRLSQAIFNHYHRIGKDPLITMGFLKEYESLLDGSPHAIELQIPLARYAYESGNVQEAKMYTEKAAAIKTDSTAVFLNRAFFAMTEGNAQEVVKNYRLIVKQIESQTKITGAFKVYAPIDVIAFLHGEEKKFPAHKLLFDYAIAINTAFMVDISQGEALIRGLLLRVADNMSFKCIENHLKESLKKLAQLQKGVGGRGKPKGGQNELPKAA
jgi:hypothetical protein